MGKKMQPGIEHPGEWLLTGPYHVDVLYREQANKRKRERERVLWGNVS